MDEQKIRGAILKTLREFLDAFSSILTDPQEIRDISLVTAILANAEETAVAELVTERLLSIEKQIVSRDTNSIIGIITTFKILQEKRTDHYRLLFDNLDENTLEIIWEYCDVFLELSKAYKKVK